MDCEGTKVAEAGEMEERILYGKTDPAADLNRVVGLPGTWEFGRVAARMSDLSAPITDPEGRGNLRIFPQCWAL